MYSKVDLLGNGVNPGCKVDQADITSVDIQRQEEISKRRFMKYGRFIQSTFNTVFSVSKPGTDVDDGEEDDDQHQDS